jgi:hypothetical protein
MAIPTRRSTNSCDGHTCPRRRCGTWPENTAYEPTACNITRTCRCSVGVIRLDEQSWYIRTCGPRLSAVAPSTRTFEAHFRANGEVDIPTLSRASINPSDSGLPPRHIPRRQSSMPDDDRSDRHMGRRHAYCLSPVWGTKPFLRKPDPARTQTGRMGG